MVTPEEEAQVFKQSVGGEGKSSAYFLVYVKKDKVLSDEIEKAMRQNKLFSL